MAERMKGGSFQPTKHSRVYADQFTPQVNMQTDLIENNRRFSIENT